MNATTVFGGIANSGKIFAGDVGIDLSTATVFGSNSTGGGITNTGTVSAAHAGIDLFHIATVVGSIVNSSTGKIIAGHGGIDVTTGTIFGAGSTAGGITKTAPSPPVTAAFS